MPIEDNLQDISYQLLKFGYTYSKCRLFTPWRSKEDAATDLLMPLTVPALTFVSAAICLNIAVVDLCTAVVNIFRPDESIGMPLLYSGFNIALTLGMAVLTAVSPIVSLANLLFRPFISLGFHLAGVDVPEEDAYSASQLIPANYHPFEDLNLFR